jgi:hypothetical protein
MPSAHTTRSDRDRLHIYKRTTLYRLISSKASGTNRWTVLLERNSKASLIFPAPGLSR